MDLKENLYDGVGSVGCRLAVVVWRLGMLFLYV
jgi:hypothetical protein